MRKKAIVRLATAILLVSAMSCGCTKEEEAYMEKADQYLEQGEYSLAVEQYNKAIMEDEQLQEAYRGAGIANLKLGDYEKAQDMFLRALGESNGIIGDIELDLSYYLGECQMCQGDYEEAAKTYSNVIEYDDSQVEAYFYRGCARLKLGMEAEAAKDFEKASKTDDLELLYGIYEAYAEAGNSDGSKYLEKIVKSKGQSGRDFYTIGKAYYKMGDLEQALDYLEKSQKEGENSAVFYLGQIYQEQGDYERAVSCYNSYKEKAGLSFGEYHTVAECMMAMGDYASVLELNQFMKESAGKSEMQSLLFEEAVLYERSGDYENARTKIREYLEQYPDDVEAQKEYEFLQTR